MSRHRLRQPLRLTRLRAVLAGGLVLGLGAAVTLAAWSDSEQATGSFQASVFDTQSSTVDAVWAHNTTSPGATLVFTGSTSMSPGASRYSWLNVRTTLSTTTPGVLSLTSSTPSGTLPASLEYRAVRASTKSTACTPAAFGAGSSFIAGDALSYLAVNTVPPTPVESAIPAAGGELRYCFEVRVKPGAANSFQGTTGSVTWLITAQSDE